MALTEEARARRCEWRAGLLRYDPDDDRKQRDAAVFDKAARLARRVGELRPAFAAAQDRIHAAHYKALAAWHAKGREGDKPSPGEAMWASPDVQAFRAARLDFTEFFHSAEYREAVGRCKVDDWTEPSDDELLEG